MEADYAPFRSLMRDASIRKVQPWGYIDAQDARRPSSAHWRWREARL
jgi:hypothetical protein